jgi:hypothetical protein
MLTRVYTQARGNSLGLSGRSRPSTKDLITEAIGILQSPAGMNYNGQTYIETKDLCTSQPELRADYEDFLQFVICRLAGILKHRFAKNGGNLFVCIHDIRRKEDKLYFPTSFDSRKLTYYVGISLRVVLCLSGSRAEKDAEYESLFCMHNEDSCFSSLLMDELKKRGVILKTDRHIAKTV